LPLTNTPEVFGLHTNAEIGYYTNAAKEMWSCLIDLQPQTGEAGTGISREAYIDKVSTVVVVVVYSSSSSSISVIVIILLHSVATRRGNVFFSRGLCVATFPVKTVSVVCL